MYNDFGVTPIGVCLVYSEGTLSRESFSDQPPRSVEEGRMCLPIGRGNKVTGLYIPIQRDDYILRASIERNTRLAVKGQSTAVNVALTNIRSRHIAPDVLGTIRAIRSRFSRQDRIKIVTALANEENLRLEDNRPKRRRKKKRRRS